MLSILAIPLLVITVTLLRVLSNQLHDPKRLRRFPSPSIAAYTPLWSMYHSWVGDQYIAIHAAHQRLGPVARIAPNHVSFTDRAAYRDIYGHGAPVLKDQFYANVADGNPSMAQATDKATHGAKRRNLAHVFSAKEIPAMEPRVVQATRNLCIALEIKIKGGKLGPEDDHEVTSDGIFDLRPWLNMLTYDAITSMFFTQGYSFLQRGTDVCLSKDAHGQLKSVHAMDSFHSAGRFNTALGQLSYDLYKLGRKLLWFVHGNESGSDFVGMARHMVHERLVHEPESPDLFSQLPAQPSEKRPMPMSLNEIVAECATMMDAGNDTTQTTLANCVYHLASNPKTQEKLFLALSAAVPRNDESFKIPGASALQRVPYLRAVLEENWRCRPPIARGLPRKVTGDGASIAGHFISSGTTVSASIYSLHRDEDLFPDALRFLPERWLSEGDQQERQNLREYCIAFSLGPRACIGRNLAYMEVSIVMAALVLNFEWELAHPGYEMPMVERFNCNPRELMIRAKIRSNGRKCVPQAYS